MKSAPIHRTSLRLRASTYSLIEQSCKRDGGKIPMSAWIEAAIAEKIERESQVVSPESGGDQKLYRFYEFFAGGGMARAGFGDGWQCLFANDFDPMKGRVYRENWGGGADLLVEDVNKIELKNLPDHADLVWASFPCQDLSLAGNYNGIGQSGDELQTRSGTFWPFWGLMQALQEDNRSPSLIVLENVYGVLTSNEGKDFAAIGAAFTEAGYRFGALVIDAKHFVPHSRPRVFLVGVRSSIDLPSELELRLPDSVWHPQGLIAAHAKLSDAAKKSWIWWSLPSPGTRRLNFVDLIEDEPSDVKWDSPDVTKRLVALMSDVNKAKVRAAQATGVRAVGALYKRTRTENGQKVQRAEVRFDDIAGCLRTPSGGSSRQHILVVDGGKLRSRLLSAREAARLMGLPDTYKLPSRYNDAYHVAGDGVAVPVVRHLAKFIFEPLLDVESVRGSASKA